MKDIKVRHMLTKEITTAYAVGREIHRQSVEDYAEQGFDVPMPSKEESLETGLYYVENSDTYEIIE